MLDHMLSSPFSNRCRTRGDHSHEDWRRLPLVLAKASNRSSKSAVHEWGLWLMLEGRKGETKKGIGRRSLKVKTKECFRVFSESQKKKDYFRVFSSCFQRIAREFSGCLLRIVRAFSGFFSGCFGCFFLCGYPLWTLPHMGCKLNLRFQNLLIEAVWLRPIARSEEFDRGGCSFIRPSIASRRSCWVCNLLHIYNCPETTHFKWQRRTAIGLQKNSRDSPPSGLGKPRPRSRAEAHYTPAGNYFETHSVNFIFCNWNEIIQENNSETIYPCNLWITNEYM